MGVVDKSLNQSVGLKTQSFNTIISYEESQIFMILNSVFLSSLVGLFGMVNNVINMIVFYKQGLDSSINITFFAMAVSDLCALILQQLFNLYVNPWFERADVVIAPSEFKYLTAGVPRAIFTRITCLITVYITMERCLCISFPLHVKQMITPRRTTIAMVMVVIYTVTWLSFTPLYCTGYVGWKFYSDSNKTLLGLIFAPDNNKVTQINYIVLTFMGCALFASVVIFTAILIRKLTEKSKWRRSTNADQANSETISSRDRKTCNIVVIIASILIICNTPTAILFVVTFVVPEFNLGGLYNNLQLVMYSFGFFFETVNSSVNFLLYLKMSTRFRDTFHEIFAFKSNKPVLERLFYAIK